MAASEVVAPSHRVVGYLPEYRYGSLNRIDFSALTHVNYFSIGATTTGALTTSGVNLSHLATARDVAHAAGVTMSITVGPQTFSTLAGDTTSLNNFVSNVVQFVQANRLDGIDLDWEPPESNATDKARYGTLIDALYTAAHPLGLLLSAAVNPITTEIPVPQANKLDWINVMAYDFDYADHSTYTAAVNSLVRWNNYGVAKDKLVMGIPFYGRSGTSWSNSLATTYADLVSNYLAANGTYPPATTDVVNGVYFNGTSTVASKAQYVVDNDFGGVMVWELGQDYFTPQGKYDTHSLLPAIKSVIQPVHDTTPPSVIDKTFLFDTGHAVKLTFDEKVGASLSASDLTVRRVDDNTVVPVNGFVYDSTTHSATFTLPTSMADGDYRATLAAGSVADTFNNATTVATTLDFFVLAGDVNHDRSVNFDDLLVLAQNYGATGRTFSQGNLDYSAAGDVEFDDLLILAQRYGTTLTIPAAAIASPAPSLSAGKRNRTGIASVLGE